MAPASPRDQTPLRPPCSSGDYPVALESDFPKTCSEDDVCSPSHGESLLPPTCQRK